MLAFVGSRRGAGVDGLADALLELVEGQGAVIQGAGQPEAIIDQDLLALFVAVVHAADLGHGHVALVDDQQVIIGQVVNQGVRRAAGRPPVEVPRVILDAGGEADLAQHLDIVAGALLDALGFDELVFALEMGDLLFQLGFDIGQGLADMLIVGDVFAGREDSDLIMRMYHLAGQGMELDDLFDLIAPKINAESRLRITGHDLQRIATHAKGAAAQLHIVAGILYAHQIAQDTLAPDLFADSQIHRHFLPIDRIANAVDARDRSHNQHIAARE